MSHQNFHPQEMETKHKHEDLKNLSFYLAAAFLGVVLAILIIDCTPIGKAIRLLIGGPA
jgi:hypothetical protein